MVLEALEHEIGVRFIGANLRPNAGIIGLKRSSLNLESTVESHLKVARRVGSTA